MKTKIIYAYTTDTHMQMFLNGLRGMWLKVGQTKKSIGSTVRIEQQDGTSDAEPLLEQTFWEVPAWLTDKMLHAQLNKMGHKFTRTDKKREWLECEVVDVSVAINTLIHGISRSKSYKMRPEQLVCAQKVTKHFKSGGKKFLINAIMRFGKTFTTYQIIKMMGLNRVLVLSYKTAVRQAWKEDLEDHVDFVGFEFFDAKTFGKGNPVKLPTHGPGCDVLFSSFQDINDMKKNKWRHIRDYHFDMVIIDEQHYGSKTDMAQKTLDKLSYDMLLEVSGTPLKALMSGDYLSEEIFSWSYADEQKQRRIEEANGWKTEIYRDLPVMNIHTFHIADEVKTNILKHYSDDEGFSFRKMTASDDGITFNDEASVKLWTDDVFGKTGHKTNSPFRTFAADHSLFYLSSVNSVTAFSRFITKHYPEYVSINVSGDNINCLDKVLDTIDRNDKTITLSCGRFNTGVTVPAWDMVVMLDDGKSPENYFQTIFRGKSPDKKRGKEECYVIDYNPSRVLEMIYEYSQVIAANSDNDTEAEVRQFCDYATIMDHRDNKIVRVDAENVLSFISDNGNYVRSFGAPSMFNWKFIDDHSSKLTTLEMADILKHIQEISDNGLIKGKNYLTKIQRKNGVIDLDRKELKEYQRKAQHMLQQLPTYMTLVDDGDRINKISDITEYDDPLFEKVVGVTNEMFASMCGTLINKSWLNRCIVDFNYHWNLDN